jgi:hypothetical protein
MTEPSRPTRPNDETREAEHADAQAQHESDRAATPEEEALAVLGHQVGDSRLIGGLPPSALWRRRVL